MKKIKGMFCVLLALLVTATGMFLQPVGVRAGALDDRSGSAEAQIGTRSFATVAEAVAAAKPGDTVQLLKDAKTTVFFLWGGITLDLNGCTLTADGIAASFPDADIIDSSAENSGLLVIPQNAFSYHHDNAQLILRTPEGYRFVDAQLRQLLTRNEEKYTFTLGMADEGSDLLIAELIRQYGAQGLNLQFRVHISWDTDNGALTQDFHFMEKTAKSFAELCMQRGSYKGRMNMTILNAVGLRNLTFISQLVIMDASGTVIQTIKGEPIVAASVS